MHWGKVALNVCMAWVEVASVVELETGAFGSRLSVSDFKRDL